MNGVDWTEYAKFSVGLVSIVNPIGTIPVFLNLTHDHTPEARRSVALSAALAVAVILVIALLAGEAVLAFFGITIASFRVAGGILLLLMALSMLQGRISRAKQTPEEARDDAARESISVVPLGLPLLAGPGAISTVILYAQLEPSIVHRLMLACGILLAAAAVGLCFRSAPLLAGLLGRTGINVIQRIMGLIMAAIGVEFIAAGARALFPGLG